MGLRPLDRMVVVSALRPHRPGLHQRLGFYRSWNISRFQSTEEQILAIQRLQPTILWAYATVLRELLERIDYQLSRIVQPRAVITVGEVMDPLLRHRLLSNLQTKLFHLFGTTEAGIIAGDCPAQEGLHVNADQVVLECLTDSSTILNGHRGKAVITTLTRRAMPLIRYESGDIISLREQRCSCGSAYPLMDVPYGREGDQLVLPSGKVLSPLTCTAFNHLDEVQQYRFIQTRKDHILVQVKLRELGVPETRDTIRRAVDSYLGEPMGLDIRLVDSFPDHKIKFRTFISNLSKG